MSRLLIFTFIFFQSCFEPKPVDTPKSNNTVDEIATQTELLPPGMPTIGSVVKTTNSASIPYFAPTIGGEIASYDLRYSVYPSMNNAKTITNISNPYLLNSLDSNTIYYFVIIAKNAKGEAASVKSSFRTQMRGPSKPSITNFTDITKNSVKIAWSESAIRILDPIDVSWNVENFEGGIIDSSTVDELQADTVRGSNDTGSSQNDIQIDLEPADTSTYNTSGSGDTDPNEVSLNSFTTTLHPVMLNRCASCHGIEQYGTSPHGATDAQTAHDAMFFTDTLGRIKVNLDTPTSSRLYTKVMEGHQCGTGCGPEILNAINDWILGGAAEPVEPPPPPPSPVEVDYTFQYSKSSNFSNAVSIENPSKPIELTGLERSTKYFVRIIATNPVASTSSRVRSFTTLTPPVGGGPIDYKVRLRVGDRRYVESVLKDVFNVNSPAADPNDIIRLQIFENPAFGGGCDRYSGKIVDNNALEHPRERCFGGMGVSDVVTFNPMRAASVSKACDVLVNNSTRFSAAYNKLNDGNTAYIFNDNHLLKAYQLFYPEQTLSDEMKTALRNIANKGNNNNEKWKYVILGICVTPEWQTLY